MKEVKFRKINRNCKIKYSNKKVQLQQYLEHQMKQLYPLEEPSKMAICFIKEQVIKISCIILIGIILLLFSVVKKEESEVKKDNTILRPAYNEAEKEISLHIKPKDHSFEEERIDVQVAPKEYTYDEFKKEIKKGKKYVNQIYLKENSSPDKIETDLFFPDRVEHSFLKIQWDTNKGHIIEETGKVDNFNLKETEIVTITVVFQYKKFEAAYSFCVSVKPSNLTEKEKFFYQVKEKIKEAENKKTDSKLCLPNAIGGKEISYEEKTSNKKIIVIIPFLFIIAVVEGVKEELERKLRKRERQLKLDYPEIMNQIALLLSAGMTIRSVFGKIAVQYEKKAEQQKYKRNYGYEEITVTYYEMENGMPEIEAFERLGERVQLITYRKLMTLLTQNARKGSKDLINLLEIEAYEAYEDRKELVKALGEEAGTKLLFPMIIMLLIVLTIVIVPVFMML